MDTDSLVAALDKKSRLAAQAVVADPAVVIGLTGLITDLVLSVLEACRRKRPDEPVDQMTERVRMFGPFESLAIRQACRARRVTGQRADQVLAAVRKMAVTSTDTEIRQTIETVDAESLYELL